VDPLAVVPQPTAEDIRAKLADIYARPEFSPDSRSTWLDKLLEAFVAFFEWLGGLHQAAPLVFWLLLFGTVLLLVVLVAIITLKVRRFVYAGTRLAGDEKAREKRERLSQTYLEEAGRRSAEEDFTEAIRCLFLALVYRFDETGRVNFQRAYTNREYLGLFDDNPTLEEHLKVFVDILDDHWYGQHPANARQYHDCLALYEKIT
jgi:hypothetical protein